MLVVASVVYDVRVNLVDVIPCRDVKLVWCNVLHLLVSKHVLQCLLCWNIQVSAVVLVVYLLKYELPDKDVGLVNVKHGVVYLVELVTDVEHVNETERRPIAVSDWKLHLEGVLSLLYDMFLSVVKVLLKLYVHFLVDVTEFSVNV